MNWIAYRVYRLTSSLRYLATRRLTHGGWIVLVGLLLTAGMATDPEQSMGYQVFSVLLCLAFTAVALAPFFRARFLAERQLPKFGTAGEPLSYTVLVRSSTARWQRGLQILDGLSDPRPSYREFKEINRAARRHRRWRLANTPEFRRVLGMKAQDVPPLPAHGEATVHLELLPLTRGVIHFDHLIVARPDPFTLFRAFCKIRLPGAVTILPKRYPLPQISLPGSQQYQHGGVALAAAIGESEEFVSLRDYRPGDPLRRIHWRSWAKVGRPVVKEYQDEFFVRHALVLDTFADAQDPAVFEEAVSVAASFACTIGTQESLLDLLFIGPKAFTFTIGRGVGHADQMLEILASVKPSSGPPFTALEQLVIEHASAVSGCIFIFVDWDEGRRRLVRKLESMGVPAIVLVIHEPGMPITRRADDPATLHVLEAGQVEAGLARL